jgi:hypothetical protein
MKLSVTIAVQFHSVLTPQTRAPEPHPSSAGRKKQPFSERTQFRVENKGRSSLRTSQKACKILEKIPIFASLSVHSNRIRHSRHSGAGGSREAPAQNKTNFPITL